MTALPHRSRVATAPRAPRRVQQHLLSEALFRDALLRGRKQAERFEEPIGLVRISLNPRTQPESEWAPVLANLKATARSTDVIGWFAQGAVIGLVRSHIDMDALETAASLEATVKRDMERCLAANTEATWRVRSDIYSPKAGSVAAPLRKVARPAGNRVKRVFHRSAKRALDIAGSAALLAVCSPVFLIIAALVKWTSKGPVFFRQERVGQHAQPFMMLKFRTMQTNAGHEIHQQYVSEYIQGRVANAPTANAAPPVFKIVGDPRVTNVGHFLRRSSLDELPQFLNVLKGEMSLVGPRPPLPYEVKCYKAWHVRRVVEAKPGITGLWQVTGRSRTTFDEMVRLDLRYARRQSLWIDLKILLATPLAVITGKGAH